MYLLIEEWVPFSTQALEKDVGFRGVTLLTPGTSKTLHTVTKFLHGLIKTLGIFLYIFVTILSFILLDSLCRVWEKAWNMKTLFPMQKDQKSTKWVFIVYVPDLKSPDK